MENKKTKFSKEEISQFWANVNYCIYMVHLASEVDHAWTKYFVYLTLMEGGRKTTIHIRNKTIHKISLSLIEKYCFNLKKYNYVLVIFDGIIRVSSIFTKD